MALRATALALTVAVVLGLALTALWAVPSPVSAAVRSGLTVTAEFSVGSTVFGSCHPYIENVWLFGNASGGLPPYYFAWASSHNASVTFGRDIALRLPASGRTVVTLFVMDGLGQKGWASGSLNFGLGPPGC